MSRMRWSTLCHLERVIITTMSRDNNFTNSKCESLDNYIYYRTIISILMSEYIANISKCLSWNKNRSTLQVFTRSLLWNKNWRTLQVSTKPLSWNTQVEYPISSCFCKLKLLKSVRPKQHLWDDERKVQLKILYSITHRIVPTRFFSNICRQWCWCRLLSRTIWNSRSAISRNTLLVAVNWRSKRPL